MQLTITKAEQWDVCSICGVYAQLDYLEHIVCRACAADYVHSTLNKTNADSITLIEQLRASESYHPLSKIGQRLHILRANLEELHAHYTEIENIAYTKYYRSYGIRQDYADELDSIYNQIVDIEDEIDSLIGPYAAAL